MNRSIKLLLACTFAVGPVFGAGLAVGTPIDPGFDLFVTQPGTFVVMDGERVDLVGRGIGPAGSDTVVQRLAGISPFGSPGGVGTVPIQLQQLHLAGTFGGIQAFVEPTPGVTQQLGAMTIQHLTATGGTFQSTLPVLASVISPDGTVLQNIEHIEFVGLGTWVHGELGIPGFSSGGFLVTGSGDCGIGRVCEIAVNPQTLQVVAEHIVSPVPEPTTLVLFGLGAAVAGVGRYLRRKASGMQLGS